MYIAMLIGLMLIFLWRRSCLRLSVHGHDVFDAAMIGKWFVFWAIGMQAMSAISDLPIGRWLPA